MSLTNQNPSVRLQYLKTMEHHILWTSLTFLTFLHGKIWIWHPLVLFYRTPSPFGKLLETQKKKDVGVFPMGSCSLFQTMSLHLLFHSYSKLKVKQEKATVASSFLQIHCFGLCIYLFLDFPSYLHPLTQT